MLFENTQLLPDHQGWGQSSSGLLSFAIISQLRKISYCCNQATGLFAVQTSTGKLPSSKLRTVPITWLVSATVTEAGIILLDHNVQRRHVCSHCVCCLPAGPTWGPGALEGRPGAPVCCCFSSSICCTEKKGRRREGGSSGWRRPHSSKLLACRHRT